MATQTAQILRPRLSYNRLDSYASPHKTKISRIEEELFFQAGEDAAAVYMRVLALRCFHGFNIQTFFVNFDVKFKAGRFLKCRQLRVDKECPFNGYIAGQLQYSLQNG